MKKRVYNFFSNPKKVVLFNAILLASAILGNIVFQAFCNPTNWTLILLIICFTNTIFFPKLFIIQLIRHRFIQIFQ